MTEDAWKERQLRLCVRRDRALETMARAAKNWAKKWPHLDLAKTGKWRAWYAEQAPLLRATHRLANIDKALRAHSEKKP